MANTEVDALVGLHKGNGFSLSIAWESEDVLLINLCDTDLENHEDCEVFAGLKVDVRTKEEL